MSTIRSITRALRHVYQRVVHRQVDARTRKTMDVLKQTAAFSACSNGTLREVAEGVHHRTYRRNEYLYYERDPGLGLFVIEQGRVRLTTGEQQDTTYELSQLGPYEMCGTLSILGDFRRMETAQAMTETQVLGFFRPDLKNLLKRNPKAGTEVLTALARYVAAQQVEMVTLMADRVGRSTALHTFAEAATRPAPQEEHPF